MKILILVILYLCNGGSKRKDERRENEKREWERREGWSVSWTIGINQRRGE